MGIVGIKFNPTKNLNQLYKSNEDDPKTDDKPSFKFTLVLIAKIAKLTFIALVSNYTAEIRVRKTIQNRVITFLLHPP